MKECAKCGATDNLVTHHISYIPEVTETLCRKCHAGERRHPEGRGLRILKSYPQQGMLLVPRDILMELGELVEIYPAPASPVAVIFERNMPFLMVRRVLGLILRDLKLRQNLQEAKPK